MIRRKKCSDEQRVSSIILNHWSLDDNGDLMADDVGGDKEDGDVQK